MHKAWWMRGRCAMPHLLASTILLVTLTGCAVKPTLPAVECPQPAPLPAALSESSLPDAQTLSSEAQTWFAEVSSFLSELR